MDIRVCVNPVMHLNHGVDENVIYTVFKRGYNFFGGWGGGGWGGGKRSGSVVECLTRERVATG